jgi:uncharacterized protein (DUF2267 family)
MRKSSSKVPSPGYTTDKPRYPALLRLNAELGFQDAALQVSELAIQVLRETAATAAIGPGAYLEEEFSRRGIPHGTLDFSTARQAFHNAALVQTYAVVDAVLRSLAREYQMHKWIPDFSWNDDSGGVMAPLDVLIAHLPPAGAARLKSAPERALLDYYRLVRVALVHRSDETLSNAAVAWKGISESREHLVSTYKLDAPNAPDKVEFTDFQLLTRSIKFFANVLNDVCDLTIPDIREFLAHKDRYIANVVKAAPKAKQFGVFREHAKARYGLNAKQAASLTQADLEILRRRMQVIEAANMWNQASKQNYRLDCLRTGQFLLTPIVKKKPGTAFHAPEPEGPFDAAEAVHFLQSASAAARGKRPVPSKGARRNS